MTSEGLMLDFAADVKLQQDAETLSRLIVDFAEKNGVQLDWSDDSIQHVERIAAELHESRKNHRASERTVNQFCDMIGSYLGEVYRKNHGAEWGWVTSRDSRFPGMQTKTNQIFWPTGRAQKRVMNGAEDNLWHYYQYLVNPDADSWRP
jgi:hypothetical protein